MKRIIFTVGGMSCQHCVNAITNAVGALDGVSRVDVEFNEKTVTVEYDGIIPERIWSEIAKQGYDVISEHPAL